MEGVLIWLRQANRETRGIIYDEVNNRIMRVKNNEIVHTKNKLYPKCCDIQMLYIDYIGAIYGGRGVNMSISSPTNLDIVIKFVLYVNSLY